MLAVLLLLLSGCRNSPRPQALERELRDSLACGDLLLLDGGTLRADAVRAMESGSSSYSHVGIVVAAPPGARTRWSVVHASPGEGTGIPEQEARVREEPLEAFLADPRIREAHLWRFRGGADTSCRAAEWARRRVGVPFDREFRFETDSALYCTELVWKAYRAVGVRLCDSVGEDPGIPFRHGKVLFPAGLLKGGRLRRIHAGTDAKARRP